MDTCRSNRLPVDSVALRNPTKNIDNYLVLSLEIFPSGQEYFNHTGISGLGFMLSNQTFKPSSGFGPYYFIANNYPYFAGNIRVADLKVIVKKFTTKLLLFLNVNFRVILQALMLDHTSH